MGIVGRRITVVVLLVLLLGSSGAGVRAQAVDAAAAFETRIAEERSARGLPAYAVAGDLRAVALRHAQRMADQGAHFHNPNLASEVGGWTLIAENVGRGRSVEDLHAAFMGSSSHRSSILSIDLTQVGVGVVRAADGELYVVQVFRRPAAAEPAPAPAPPTTVAPPPAPPITAPPTTVAPVPSVTAPPVTAPPTVEVLANPVVAAPVAPATVGRATKAEIVTARTPTPAIDIEQVTRHVPAAAWIAAGLLAAVVALQGQTLRRLGLA